MACLVVDIQKVVLEHRRILKQFESGCIIDLEFPSEKKVGWIKFPFLAGKQLVWKGFHT